MELEPGLRRDPYRDPEAVGEDLILIERLRDEIRASGPIIPSGRAANGRSTSTSAHGSSVSGNLKTTHPR